jgi:putative membrane protein
MLKRLFAAAAALTLFAGIAMAAGLNDAQIAHIAYTAGQIDIDTAKLALSKTKNDEIRAFAQNMLDDHTAVNNQALALLKKLKVTPTSTTRSPTTRRSTRRWRRRSSRQPKMPT